MALDSNVTKYTVTTLRWPLSTKMTLSFLVTLIIPTIVMGVLLYNQQRNETLRNAENAALSLGQLKVHQIDLVQNQLAREVERLVLASPDTQLYINALDRNPTDEDMAAAADALESLWTDRASVVFVRLVTNQPDTAASRGLENILPNRQTQGDLARNIGETQITSIYAGPNNEPLLDIVVSFKTVEGRVLGNFVLTQDLSRTIQENEISALPDFYAALNEIPTLDGLPTAHIFLFNHDGVLVGATTNRNAMFSEDFSSGIPLARTLNEDPRAVNRYGFALTSLGNRVDQYDSPITNEPVIGFYQRIPDTRWTVAVEFPEDEVFSTLNRQFLPRLVALVLAILFVNLLAYALFHRITTRPVVLLTDRMNTLSLARTIEPILPSSRDEFGQLMSAYNRMTSYAQREFLEKTAENESLQNRLNLLFDLNQVIGVMDTEFMMSEAARLIRERYQSVSHVQIYEANWQQQKAVLKAATGDLGRRLLVQEYEQSLADGGLIANTVLFGNPILVNNVAASIDYRMPPEFASTRAILCVPIKARNEVIGVLDVHSNEVGAFTPSDTAFFTAFGAELGVALGVHPAAEEISAFDKTFSTGRLTRRGVSSMGAVAGHAPGGDNWTPLQREAMLTRTTTRRENPDENTITFAIPLTLRNEILGAIEWTVDSDQFNVEMLQTASDLARRLALATDNAQLFEQSQRLIERERRVNEITQKITAQNDIDQILQTAVRELGQAIGSSETVIKLNLLREDS